MTHRIDLQSGGVRVIFNQLPTDYPMKLQSMFAAGFLASFPFILTACGSGNAVSPAHETSVGQQLSDLDNAYRQGIISEREYKRLKKALINRYD
jgi:hypothetical protein